MRSLARLWPLLLLACAERPLASTSAGGSTTGATGTTTGATTTGMIAPGSTGSTDVSTTAEPSSTGDGKPDVPNWVPPPPGLVGCTLKAPPGTAVEGQTIVGPFTADRAYFGAFILGGKFSGPTFMLLSPGADAATELEQQQGKTGAFARIEMVGYFDDDWLGTWETSARVGAGFFDDLPVTVTIAEIAGNWDAPDPADPPRLRGSLADGLAGSFDAVYCDLLDIVVHIE